MYTKKLSLIIPCYNEEKTLKKCIDRVVDALQDATPLEIVIVDDCSKDKSLEVARGLENKYGAVSIKVAHHEQNQGKGAAIRTGIQLATGDFIGVQDADMEYDPKDLIKVLAPLNNDEADVVLGSRFLSTGVHRVLYFWHSMGNAFLTFLSNMFTDLNLTDMECCYKLFKKDIIKSIKIEENRFGFEPEVVAKVAQMRVRIFETGVSYKGRTYAEGKKIGVKDGFRALYCIVRYNAPKAPMPIQFLFYIFIGGVAALFNLFLFLGMTDAGMSLKTSALTAFFAAAVLNYILCVLTIFRHNAKWKTPTELLIFVGVVVAISFADLYLTKIFIDSGSSAASAKMSATLIGLFLNFAGRKYLVFPEKASGEWKNQERN